MPKPQLMADDREAGSMGVCLLSSGFPPGNTEGVSRSTNTLALGLRDLGHRVHVLTAMGGPGVLEGIKLHSVSADARCEYRFLAEAGCPDLQRWLDYSHRLFERVRELSGSERIDVVDSPLWQLEGLVTAISRIRPVAVRVVTAMRQIASIHGDVTAETNLMGDLEAKFLGLADVVVSNSQATEEAVRHVYGVDVSGRAHRVVPYGMVPTPDREVHAATGGAPGNVTVLFVGRLEGRKGILTLFHAIPEVLRAAPRTRFVIAGADNSARDGFRQQSGLDYPTYFRQKWPAAAGQVSFLGLVPELRLRELYRTCDLFVAPSVYESFGLVYLEAMDQARPVIGCAAGGPAEVIVDGETGLLVAPDVPVALAEAIAMLIGQPQKRREMGVAGRRRLLERFTHVRMAEGFVAAYQQATGQNTTGRDNG